MKIEFLGAAQEVTGSKHLITTKSGKKILLDCGMYQGKGEETDKLNKKLGFDPMQIDYIILSHAHIDHSGLLPYAYKLGFNGSIICTNATRDLCSIMLADAGHIQEMDTRNFNKRRLMQGLPPIDPLFTKADAVACMEKFIGIPYDFKFRINDDIKVKFTNTGHMLGSGVINLEITENDKTTKIAYTGDIGRPVNRILIPPQPFPQADILITEATYGDRLHKDKKAAEEELYKVIQETCVDKNGKLIIPSFSVGRAQELAYSLNNLYNNRRLPKIDVYVDSPLAVNATEIFRMHPECFNDDILAVMDTDPDPFGFNSMHYIKMREDSKKLNKIKKPCIIISASGMMEAGRVKHHLANSIDKERNTILAVGYCAPTTLGAKILRGDKIVSIHGVKYPVKAEIRRLDSFSGHGDYKEMIDFIECQDKKKLQKVFIVHGEHECQKFYKGKLEEKGFENIEIPAIGDEFEI